MNEVAQTAPARCKGCVEQSAQFGGTKKRKPTSDTVVKLVIHQALSYTAAHKRDESIFAELTEPTV